MKFKTSVNIELFYFFVDKSYKIKIFNL